MVDFVKSATLLTETVNDITRKLHAHSAYDERGKKPDYGCHGMEFVFSVQRGQAAVEVLWMTNWELPSSRNDRPMAFSGLGQITSHSPVALYPEHEPSSHQCEITAGDCYILTSFIDAGGLFEQFVRDPSTLWPELERRLIKLEAQIETERSNARNL